MRDERGPWYLLTGFLLGVGLGLLYAWVASPVEYVDTSPFSLRKDFKDQYRALIAAAFVANGDLARARARLDLLGDADLARALAEQAQHTLAEERSPKEAQALGLLAAALGQGPAPLEDPSSTKISTLPPTFSLSPVTPVVTITITATLPLAGSETSTPSPTPGNGLSGATRTPLPGDTPLPTRTPTTTPGAPFVLQERTFVCDQKLAEPLIQVLAEDAHGQQVPGVEVVVNWEGGEDHFFTGLKQELGLGYADFSMTPGLTYSLRLAGSGQVIQDLAAAECETTSGGRYWGSWLLLFVQP